jgi:hypothetical protein
MSITRTVTVALVAAIAWAGPAGASDSSPQGSKPAPPKAREVADTYDLLQQSAVRPATRFFDIALLGRKLTHHPREAANVDENDQVRLSTWWQPRIGFQTVTVEQMLQGPGPGTGPAAGRWTVTKAKSHGVSTGFEIKDSAGDRYVIKFDTPQFPGAATAADVIGSHLMWLAGYNVPDNSIAFFGTKDLDIGKDATYTDTHGRKKPITKAYLDQLLASTAPPVNGRYRCLASRYLPGKPLGPFSFDGRRKDDPEDLVPHELRRELRGLWTLAAWINHSDCRGANSLDMWVTQNDRSFVRHYLIDFGSTLGSTATPFQRDYSTGFEYYVDYKVVARETATLGLSHARWESIVDPHLPSVGIVESQVFDPGGWRPDYPNPAFDERTIRDVRWGARILAGVTDDHIRAAVAAGQLPDPATEYLTQVLIERRDKLVHRWLGPVAPPTLANRSLGAR